LLQDIIVTGLVNGGVYALLAIGFSLIFGVARIVNIAHTAFYMLAAYCFYALLVKVQLGFLPAALLSVGGVTLLSVLCYRLVIEPVCQCSRTRPVDNTIGYVSSGNSSGGRILVGTILPRPEPVGNPLANMISLPGLPGSSHG